ncbi:hypothetical protein HDK90DRAFT_227465 [Phyllosticta capitalensis]|uniref:Secreted protein n=1 Tax=Phyllosticta capitalensis TaxID=121624 RepID=A0ABR1YU44_9PEZI
MLLYLVLCALKHPPPVAVCHSTQFRFTARSSCICTYAYNITRNLVTAPIPKTSLGFALFPFAVPLLHQPRLRDTVETTGSIVFQGTMNHESTCRALARLCHSFLHQPTCKPWTAIVNWPIAISHVHVPFPTQHRGLPVIITIPNPKSLRP